MSKNWSQEDHANNMNGNGTTNVSAKIVEEDIKPPRKYHCLL